MSKGVKQSAVFGPYYETLLELAGKMPKGVRFEHVYGHSDDPGNQAVIFFLNLLNMQADELARQAAQSSVPRRARSESKSRVKDRSWSRGRTESRENNKEHIRSHSAFVRSRKN